MALSTKTLDALNDSRKTEPHKYIWGQFTPDKEGVGYADLPEQTIIPDDAKLVLDVNGPSLVKASVKDLKSGASSVDIATTEKAGIIKVGNTLTVTEDGTLNADTDTLATKTELAVALNDRADKQLSNTNLITNCILSAPNGVLQVSVDLSEQINTAEATISNNVLTAGNAKFSVDSTSHGVDKSKVWKIKTTFTITTAEANTNLTSFYRTSRFDNFPDDYYLEIFGVRYQNSTLTFEFLRGINNVVSFSTRAQRSTTIEAGKKYTATYRSDGFISLYQGDTKILEETRSSYSFATVFPAVVESKAYGDVYWRSDSATIDFRNSNFTYNDGGKVVPVVGDPYTLTVNKGLKVALANGYNTDGTPKSEIVTLENDTTVTVPSSSNYNYPIDVILIKPVSGGASRIVVPRNTDFCVLDSNLENIDAGQYKVWYNKNTNLYYEHLNGVTTAYGGVLLGSGKFVDSKFTDIVSYKPIQLSLEGFGDYVVEYQVNANSSWYRKYKSGWLEQGGIARLVSAGAVIPLAKPFAYTNYVLIVSPNNAIDGSLPIAFGYGRTTTSFSVNGTVDAQSVIEFSWEAKGIGAS